MLGKVCVVFFKQVGPQQFGSEGIGSKCSSFEHIGMFSYEGVPEQNCIKHIRVILLFKDLVGHMNMNEQWGNLVWYSLNTLEAGQKNSKADEDQKILWLNAEEYFDDENIEELFLCVNGCFMVD